MPELPSTFSGGCACGAVRYQSSEAPVMMLNCHCRDCQRSSGGGYASFVVVPKEAFRVTQGELRFYGTPSEARGLTRRGFCAECGTPVAGTPDAAPGVLAIRVASLDDPSWFAAQMDVWTIDAQVWDRMDPATTKFVKYPG